jgi:hypothetical protein
MVDQDVTLQQSLNPWFNLYDWYVCVRDGKVEALWPVSARGARALPVPPGARA